MINIKLYSFENEKREKFGARFKCHMVQCGPFYCCWTQRRATGQFKCCRKWSHGFILQIDSFFRYQFWFSKSNKQNYISNLNFSEYFPPFHKNSKIKHANWQFHIQMHPHKYLECVCAFEHACKISNEFTLYLAMFVCVSVHLCVFNKCGNMIMGFHFDLVKYAGWKCSKK